MKFQMDRESGDVTFTGLKHGSSIKINWPVEEDPKKARKATMVNKKGIAVIPFGNKRKMFHRQICNIKIEHKDYETIEFDAEIRMTKLIQKPISEQVKKVKS